MKPDKNNSIGRFRIILILMCIVGLYIISSALYTMLAKRDYWTEVSRKFIRENIAIPATRGNIYDCKGRLMAGSVPEYHIYMDYVVIDKDSVSRRKAQAWRDSVFHATLDSISEGLARIFPDRRRSYKANTKWFRDRLLEGKRRKSHAWRIYPLSNPS